MAEGILGAGAGLSVVNWSPLTSADSLCRFDGLSSGHVSGPYELHALVTLIRLRHSDLGINTAFVLAQPSSTPKEDKRQKSRLLASLTSIRWCITNAVIRLSTSALSALIWMRELFSIASFAVSAVFTFTTPVSSSPSDLGICDCSELSRVFSIFDRHTCKSETSFFRSVKRL